ncbi:7TM-DISM domain-containing protein [Fulvivirga sp.]|uniref:7TM-DISM domain-containing protein n=1 Tax=Fulvivirga sp. TaxID=1931237 RepID=UPI0032EE1063
MSGFSSFWASQNKVFRISIILLLLASITYGQGNRKPFAIEGKLNLTSWDIDQNPIELNGDWFFYWSQILTPQDGLLSFNQENKNIKSFPGLWTDYEGDTSYPSFGFASYLLIIEGLEKDKEYALKVPDMYCSYQLWVGSKLVASNGKIGRDAESYEPEWRPVTVNFVAERETESILLNISNFDHSKGGIKNSIVLGPVEHLASQRTNEVAANLIRIIGIALISIISLAGFFLYSKKLFTYFSIFSILWSVRGIFSNMYLIYSWIPDFNWTLGTKIEYLTIYTSVLVGYHIFHNLFPNHSNKIISWASIFINSTFIIITLVSPAVMFTELLNIYFGLMGLLLAYILINVIQAYIYDEKGAGYLAVAITLIIILFFYDMLSYYKFLPYNPYITSIGYVILYGLLGYTLRYNQLHKSKDTTFKFS